MSKLIVGSLAGGSGLNAASKARTLVQFPSLEEIRRFRHVGRDLDLFFVSAFYPEVQHRCDMEFRYQIMKEIKRHRELASIAAFAGKPSGPYSPFQCDRYTLRAYLRNLARARVAIYVRGLHGCLSFKIGQYLALGMPIVGQTILNKGSALCRDENISKQFAFGSPEEIVSRAVRLLREPGERKALGQANARAFDARLTPQATTADIVERLRLYASQGSAIADNISELRVLTKSPSTIGGW